MDKIQRLFRYKILPIYWVFLTYILLKPIKIKSKDLLLTFDGMDKCIHVLLFAVLALCYLLSFMKSRFLVFLGIIGGYALATEVLQEVMGLGRSMEMLDWLADMLGILLAFGVWKRYSQSLE